MARTSTARPSRTNNVVPIASTGLVALESFIDRRIAIREDIARRAYEIYESRGRVDGFDVEDWLSAESEMLAQTRVS